MNRRKRASLLAGLVLLLGSGLATAATERQTYWPPITDPPTGTWTPGRWVWAELLTRDVGTAAEFYGKVFGWTFVTYGPKDDARTYTVVSSGGTPIAGMVFINPRDRSMKPDARWIGMVSVNDVAVAEGRVVNAGGKVLMPARPLGERGTAALLADPEGGVFGIIHSATGDPDDYLGDENSFLWAELWANDPEAMAKFYAAATGYEIVGGALPGETKGYHLASGGYARAGILPKPLPNTPTAWIPYVRVRSVDETTARAREAGGRIAIEPMSAHGTRVALLVDPTGAPLAIAEWHGN